MIACCSQQGDYWYSIVQGGVTSEVYLIFIKRLIEELKRIDENYFMHLHVYQDNASSHRSEECLEFLREYPISNTGVAFCKANPVETTFGIIKYIYQTKFSKLLQKSWDPRLKKFKPPKAHQQWRLIL